MLSQVSEQNDFLSRLSAADYEALSPDLMPMTLSVGAYVYRAGGPVSEVVFPRSGLVVMRMRVGDQSGAGIVLIGRDGVVAGMLSAASAPALCDAVVLVAGDGLRMPAAAFRQALEARPGIRSLATRFSAAMIAQAQQTASCAMTHSVEKRLSRWFLEIADRTGTADVPLLQSELAEIIGVQRTTVNFAVGQLERVGAIISGRGRVRIADRPKLEGTSCECYGRLKAYVAGLVPAVAVTKVAVGCVPAEKFQVNA